MSTETAGALLEGASERVRVEGERPTQRARARAKRGGPSSLARTLLLLALPAAALLVLLNLAPLFFAGWESLHLGDMIASGPFAGLRNYVRELSSSNFWSAALFTLIFTVVGVFGSWVVGLALALFLRTRIPLSGLWRALLVLPWIIPIPTSAQFWSSLVAAPLPMFHHAAGLGAIEVFADPVTARILVCVFRLWVSFPFMMLMMSSALTSVDPNVYEAAQVDGASRWQTFTRITLPLISRTTYVSWILMAIFCVNDYPSIANLTDGGPINATQTLVVLAWQTANEQGFSFGTGIGQATAIGFLMAIVLVICAVVLYRLTRTTGEGTVSAASMGGSASAGPRAGRGAGQWWRLAAIVLVTAVLLFPVGKLLYSDVLGGGTMHGLEASVASVFTGRIWSMFWRSGMLASVSVVVCVLIGAPAGYAIARAKGRAISGFTILVFAVQSFPVLLLLWPMLMLSFRLHLVWPALGPLPVVQVIYVGMSLGFAVWMFSAFLKTMPIEIEEAAWADGCSVIGAFFRVVLPNAIPAVISTGIFVFLLTWGDWQVAGYLITPVLTPNAIPTLGVGGITSLAFLVPPLVIFFVFNRYFSLGGVAASFSRR